MIIKLTFSFCGCMKMYLMFKKRFFAQQTKGLIASIHRWICKNIIKLSSLAIITQANVMPNNSTILHVIL